MDISRGRSMKTVLEFDIDDLGELPEGFESEVRFTESFAQYFIGKFTEKGDSVLDPFAGFGTSLKAAEQLGRNGYGIEYDKHKVQHIESKISDAEIVEGSALEVDSFELPKFELCITSPPYMARSMCTNPLQNYSGKSNYEEYLERLKELFEDLRPRIKSGGHVLVEVSNMKVEGDVTTLAWDIKNKISESFKFEGEIVIIWKESNELSRSYGFDHSYALLFCKE